MDDAVTTRRAMKRRLKEDLLYRLPCYDDVRAIYPALAFSMGDDAMYFNRKLRDNVISFASKARPLKAAEQGGAAAALGTAAGGAAGHRKRGGHSRRWSTLFQARRRYTLWRLADIRVPCRRFICCFATALCFCFVSPKAWQNRCPRVRAASAELPSESMTWCLSS